MITSQGTHKTITQFGGLLDKVADTGSNIRENISTMDTTGKRPAQPPNVPRGRKKKRDSEEKKDDNAAGGSNDGGDKRHKRPIWNIDAREETVRPARGIESHSHLASTRSPRAGSKSSKPATRKPQISEAYRLERQFYLTDGEIQKDAKLDKVQEDNDIYLRPYRDWSDHDPWCWMAFGNGIEPLANDEISFLHIDTDRRCEHYLSSQLKKPADRNCHTPWGKCRAKNCACHGPMQEGMKAYYKDHFPEGGVFAYNNPQDHPISQDVLNYYASRIQFLTACRDLVEQQPRFTDRQIYRHLRQSANVVELKEKSAIIFHGDVTKREVLPLMVPSCISHLLEPLGLFPDMSKFKATGHKKKAVKVEMKKDEYKATKSLNYRPGVRTYGAFFASKDSDSLPFPGKNDRTILQVTSCEYPALLKLKWGNLDVAGRLEIFKSEDAKEDTLNGSYCHRIDFNQRFSQSSQGMMILHSFLLTKIHYNLVGITDRPAIIDAYENFRLLYGESLLLPTYKDSFNHVCGCLTASLTAKDHLLVIASGYLAYSHEETVTLEHGYRCSVSVLDEHLTENHGLNALIKKFKINKELPNAEKDKLREENIKKSYDEYLEKAKDRDLVTNFLDLYKPKCDYHDWDTTFEDYTEIECNDPKKPNGRIGVKHNRVKHTVIALRGNPVYFHDTDFGKYDADYGAFVIPHSLQAWLPQFHQHILHEHGYEIREIISKGMTRINGNDNLFTYKDFVSCTEFFQLFSGASAEQIPPIVNDLIKAVQNGCEIALYRKVKGVLNQENCCIRMRLQCNVPDLTKTTMECKKTAYPLSQISQAAKEGIVVLSGILPLHNTGLLHQAYSGTMRTDIDSAGTRFKDNKKAFSSFRGLPVFIAPNTFVLYPGSLPIATGMTVTPGISYYIELDVQMRTNSAVSALPSTALKDRSGLDCYLTSAGPAMTFLTSDEGRRIRETLEIADKCLEETSFGITKDLTLPSVVYWSKHGKPSDLGQMLLDQIDPTLEELGRSTWFGHFEYPTKPVTNDDATTNQKKKVAIPPLGGFASDQQQPSTQQNANQASQMQSEAAADSTAQLHP